MTQMLEELRRQAACKDKTLAYLIEMAMVHSMDLDAGKQKGEPLIDGGADQGLETTGAVAVA